MQESVFRVVMRRFRGKLILAAQSLSVASSQIGRARLNQIRTELEKIDISSKSTQRAKSINKKERMREEREFEDKRKEASEFIHKIMTEKKARRKLKIVQEKLEHERERKRFEEEVNRSRSREENVLRQRREASLKLYERIKREREEDQKRKEEARRSLSKSHQGQYLYKKLENKYNMEVVFPMLEEKKRELAKKRNQYKAIDKEELLNHAKKYEQIVAQREESRRKELKAKKEKDQGLQMEIAKLKTPGMERLELEKIAEQEEHERKEQKKKELKEKVEFFIAKLKQMRPTKASPKAEESKRLVESKTSIRKSRDIRRIYTNINKSVKTIDNPHSSTDVLVDKPPAKKHIHRIKRTKKHQQLSDDAKRAEASLSPKKIDYLRKLRRAKRSAPVEYDWLKDLRNDGLDASEKYRRVVEKVNLMEERARAGEAVLRAREGSVENPEIYEAVSGMLVDAIKAKLAILENL